MRWLSTLGVFAVSMGVAREAASLGLVAAATPGFGTLALRSGIALVGVCALAYVALRFGARHVQPATGAMEVEERMPLDARRQLVIVRVEGRRMILGVSEAGVQKIDDLEEAHDD